MNKQKVSELYKKMRSGLDALPKPKMEKIPGLEKIRLEKIFTKKIENKKIYIFVALPVAAIIAVTVMTSAYNDMDIETKAALGFAKAYYQIVYNDIEVAAIEDKIDPEEFKASIISELEKETGLKVELEGNIEVDAIASGETQALSMADAQNKLKNSIKYQVYAYGVLVNDEVVVATKTETEATGLLDTVKKMFLVEDSSREVVETNFAEKVEVKEVLVPLDKVSDLETALQVITTGTEEKKEYTVQMGESFWSISRSHNISEEDLQKANPEIKPERLRAEQVISMVVPKPFITVMTKEKVTFNEPIPYKTITKTSDQLYKGESRVQVSGTNGTLEKTVYVYKLNGIEDKERREVISENVTKNPVDRVVVQGTKPVPSTVGSGSFAMPTVGNLTSAFGVPRGGSRHTGIDLANSSGTPIRASDGGLVIFSGWQGNYGNLIIIDHGGGFQTYYAHNRANLVTAGNRVFKDQHIANMGSTGYSTGPHLHFEIRRFGTPVNPYIYLP